MDIGSLKEQIKRNCTISDARFWGSYSLCGLLMRMRELYRDEHSLKPWESIPKEAMAEWIARRESQWQTLEDCTPAPIEINGTLYDPFDVDGLNMLLSNHGLLYGGGLTLFSKPTFFLAALEGRKEFLDYRIHYAGEELCRDLSASVAMLQGRCIFMRLHTLAVLLWEKAHELRSGKCGSLVKEAFSGYGIQRGAALPEDLYGRMRELAHEISDIFVLHEIGEAFEDDHHELWQEITVSSCDRLTEFYLRGIKDVLADTSDRGPLSSIVAGQNRLQLNFYMVFFNGIRREVFPEMGDAFRGFAEDSDWSLLEEARVRGHRRAVGLRDFVLESWNKEGVDRLGPAIKQRLISQTMPD